MKQTIPAKTVEVCDLCHREAYLQSCAACGRQFCLLSRLLRPRRRASYLREDFQAIGTPVQGTRMRRS